MALPVNSRNRPHGHVVEWERIKKLEWTEGRGTGFHPMNSILPFCIGLLLQLVVASYTQGQPGRYTAYGSYPVKTPDSLLKTYRIATLPEEQLLAAEQLMNFHQLRGVSDSVIYYAHAMETA